MHLTHPTPVELEPLTKWTYKVRTGSLRRWIATMRLAAGADFRGADLYGAKVVGCDFGEGPAAATFFHG